MKCGTNCNDIDMVVVAGVGMQWGSGSCYRGDDKLKQF